MLLKDFLQKASKADLQRYYLYWCPEREMTSSRERLADDLQRVMSDPELVRKRFDSLGRSQQAFLTCLLAREGYRGRLEEILADPRGRQIEPFETEALLKKLLTEGYVVRAIQGDGYSPATSPAGERFLIPGETGDALRRTVAIERREPLDMLSRDRARESRPVQSQDEREGNLDALIRELPDEDLRALVTQALDDHNGLLTYSKATLNGVQPGALNREDWRRWLEEKRIGTTGILCLKDYGIDLEEEALIVYQELIYEHSLDKSQDGVPENDVEITLGTDLLVDVDRMLELLRGTASHSPAQTGLELTRAGKLYKKTEEKIANTFITNRYRDIFGGSVVQYLLEVCRRLHFFEVEGQKIVGDPLRLRAWQKKALTQKLKTLYELFLDQQQGSRWSFHQKALREVLLDLLLTKSPGRWLGTQRFLNAVVALYLLRLESAGVREEFRRRWEDDFRNETLMVPFVKLHHDLSYWILHRLALLGIVDVGYRDGVFQALRLSSLGQRLFGLCEEGVDDGERPALVNPDFEVLVFPGGSRSDDANMTLGRFADRMESDRVKRYRLTRDSVKRGIVSGLSGAKMIQLLREYSRSEVPSNVVFSLEEWADGIELVRCQRALLLRAKTPKGLEQLVFELEQEGISFERLNSSTVAVRGSRNEKAVLDLRERFLSQGLVLE